MMRPILGALILIALGGCETAYYETMEKVGVHKRDILVDRVEEAMESQEDAKQEFKDALEQFSSVVTVPSSELKSTYEELSDAYDDANDKAEEVSERIDSVESVSEALFEEWKDEIDEYSSDNLRRASLQQMRSSESKYKELMASMRRAESKMAPVLSAFKDNVLFLKHNLNAQAISSLKTELRDIETNVAALIREMEVSIERSQAFIRDMESIQG